MAICPNISMLRFSHSSEAAIEEIKRVQKAGNMLASVLGGSILLKIFTGHRIQLQGSAHNIVQKDWKLWAEAMQSIPSMIRNRIRYIAFQQSAKVMANDEREFWRAVADGCH